MDANRNLLLKTLVASQVEIAKLRDDAIAQAQRADELEREVEAALAVLYQHKELHQDMASVGLLSPTSETH